MILSMENTCSEIPNYISHCQSSNVNNVCDVKISRGISFGALSQYGVEVLYKMKNENLSISAQ